MLNSNVFDSYILYNMFYLLAKSLISDKKRFSKIADPVLEDPKREFRQLLALTSMCLERDPVVRPSMEEVV